MLTIESLFFFMLLASTASGFNLNRFLQEATDSVAPFALSAGLAGSGGNAAVGVKESDDDSGSAGAATIIIAVIVTLLFICCCCCVCLGGGYYFYKKRGNKKEDIVAQKNAALGVPYGGDHRGALSRQQQTQYSDTHSQASSTLDHMSFD